MGLHALNKYSPAHTETQTESIAPMSLWVQLSPLGMGPLSGTLKPAVVSTATSFISLMPSAVCGCAPMPTAARFRADENSDIEPLLPADADFSCACSSRAMESD